jgi:uncharacterized protein YjiS (DUF1127 family)
MAYATQTQPLSGNVFAAVSAFFAELSEAAERRRVYKTTYAELASLSARELSDIGLSRANIGAIAYEAAYE